MYKKWGAYPLVPVSVALVEIIEVRAVDPEPKRPKNDMNDSSNITEVFQFTDNEREIFEYIDDYMRRMSNWIAGDSKSEEQLFRYMLIGLFLEYLATMHQGGDFNTILETWDMLDTRPRTHAKLVLFNQVYGMPLENTAQYLDLIGLRTLNNVSGERLARYVIDGEAIG